jgi:hypothetical protein
MQRFTRTRRPRHYHRTASHHHGVNHEAIIGSDAAHRSSLPPLMAGEGAISRGSLRQRVYLRDTPMTAQEALLFVDHVHRQFEIRVGEKGRMVLADARALGA